MFKKKRPTERQIVDAVLMAVEDGFRGRGEQLLTGTEVADLIRKARIESKWRAQHG